MSGRMNFAFEFSGNPAAQRRPDAPFRLAFIADLGQQADLSHPFRCRRLDVDQFESFLEELNPRLSLSGHDDVPVELDFEELEHFHPDAIVQRVDAFRNLRATRKALNDPAQFSDVAARLQDAAKSTDAEPESEGDLFDRLLGAPRSTGSPSQIDLSAFLDQVVGPHLVPDTTPEQAALQSSIDAASADLLRAILHHPKFQQLESAWRGLWELLTRVEWGDELQLFVIDASLDRIRADLAQAGDQLENTELHRVLVRDKVDTPDGTSWGAICANYTLNGTDEDAQLVAKLGAIASRAGGPILAGAHPSLVGCEELCTALDTANWSEPSPLWQAVRESDMAPWIGLAMPRMLLRLPYGSKTDEIDAFEFEELGTTRTHEHYLWGNPALPLAILLGTAFTERGPAMQPGDHNDLGDLPSHAYREDGESKLQPCAEVLIPERTGQALLEHGLIPVLSFPQRNAVRVMRFQSIASPPAPLAGF